jgi:hypothetical protein
MLSLSLSMNCLDALSSCGFWLRLCRSSSLRAWSRTHGWVYIARPHTGVPEIGRSIQTHPCRTKGSALPVASAKRSCSLPAVHQHSRRRDRLRKSTDLLRSIPPKPFRTKDSALPLASAKTSCSIPVAHHLSRRRDRVCKSTDFWYSSMTAVCIHDLARSDTCVQTAKQSEGQARSDARARTAQYNEVQTRSDTCAYKN